ncbi:hypothetical protein [Cohnella laeviribosi]|uniref:hypothetical protein n=1 Tax=Cohnella laeviribosi TaxID=380174 RepID=UPI0003727F7E|nr:hypothetical protein [Cohnella laeviribosi]
MVVILIKVQKYYKYGLIIVFIISLSVLFFFQYNEKVKYQKYISNQMNDDLHTLINSINEDSNLYDVIISTNKITKDQSKTLMVNNENIRNIIVEYRNLAVVLKKRKDGYQYDSSSVNAYKLARLYYEWHEEFYDSHFNGNLDMKKQSQIKASNQLNSSWLEVTNKLASIRFNLSNKEWLNLIDALESKTISFMEKNKIDNIEEVWVKEQGIK